MRLFAIGIALGTLLAACGSDDNGGSEANGRQTTRPTAASTPVRSPVIGVEPLTLPEALAELDNIESMIRNPNQDLISQLGIVPAAVEQRTKDTFEGVTNTGGLNEVRRLLTDATPDTEHSNRILAGETLRNITDATIIPAFGSSDASAISPEEIAELDPLFIWTIDPEDGLPVTAIWRDAVARIIFLWYRL